MLFDGQVLRFVLNFIIDSIKNTIAAFMWPVTIIQIAQPYGAIALGIAFWLFPIYVKKHIEGWLFADDDAAQQAEAKDEPSN